MPEKQNANPRGWRSAFYLAEWTGLEPATPGVTGRYSNQLNYHSRTTKLLVALGYSAETGAGNEARTRDLNLGKVALYQLSYSRIETVAPGT